MRKEQRIFISLIHYDLLLTKYKEWWVLMILLSDALDALQLKRYCCRRMLLAHVDLIEKLYVISLRV